VASIFSKIISGEVLAYKVAEDDNYLAFLDIFPLQKGHVLVIPKIEEDYIFDLEDSVYLGLMKFAKGVARKIEKVIPCDRIGVTVIGLEVPHAHVHLIPINQEKDMNFSNKKLQFSTEEMREIAEQIMNA
jgi:histidine triad (HIT) family protein